MKQIEFKLPTWGGKRKNAGRRPNGDKPGVSHLRRPSFAPRHPVHVTLRLLSGVGFLRAFSRVRAIEQALREIKHRFGMRVVHYSIQGNHLHLIVEIDDPSMLPHAIQGFAVRLARALNEIASRNGKVFLDRYHAHVLKTRREVSNAVRELPPSSPRRRCTAGDGSLFIGCVGDYQGRSADPFAADVASAPL